jgi:hypothetical protein
VTVTFLTERAKMLFEYPAAYKTEIYISEAKNICIKQSNFPEEEVLVVLTLDQAQWLLSKLPTLIDETIELRLDEGVQE